MTTSHYLRKEKIFYPGTDRYLAFTKKERHTNK